MILMEVWLQSNGAVYRGAVIVALVIVQMLDVGREGGVTAAVCLHRRPIGLSNSDNQSKPP